MINFFVTRKKAHIISPLLVEWSKELKKNLKVIAYDQLPIVKAVAPGAFVFSDLERLTENQLALICDFCDQLQAYDLKIPIINHPRTALTRFNLLQKLHAEGINRFNAYPATDLECDIKYPVFLRLNNDHSGPRSGLLKGREQRDVALMQAVMSGFDVNQLLQVEFCETKSDDGFYRKYSAFRIGEYIIPGHIIFNTDWIAKDGEPPGAGRKREQEKYMADNPHADQIIEIFKLAGIEYGRIDYSIFDGTIQTWEINTNPVLIRWRKSYKWKYISVKKKLATQLEAALQSLDYTVTNVNTRESAERITLQWKPEKYI